jgi:putative DNA primase/helicase
VTRSHLTSPAPGGGRTINLEAALRYAARGWEVFPCQWQGHYRKQPLAKNGCHDASADSAAIIAWWQRWPEALVGFATGRANQIVVLDVDCKGETSGFDTLADLGYAILPVTPMAHTPSSGLHLYFLAPDHVEIRNTEGKRGRGIGHGVDWRGTGGYVVVPTLGSGYRWDPQHNLWTVPIAPVPLDLLPRAPTPTVNVRPLRPVAGLGPYGESALNSATRRILDAPNGEQETTLNAEAFAIGTLAGAGGLPPDFARKVLKWAARHLISHDPRRPWREAELEGKVDRAFDAGMRHPRRARP